ncbi:MAG: acylphosphatase [Chitinophagaceae bacterium]|nr:acylphosphatase [Chitinophagaceae bacterium]
MLKTISITVKGKVQGVYFRHNTREKAVAEGITGYVKNLPDGSVLIIASGTERQLQQLEQWCHTGPKEAKVSGVISQELPHTSFARFTIER